MLTLCANRFMALIELAATADQSCSRLVICLSRAIDGARLQVLIRDLGWVGFQLTTLDEWMPKEKGLLSQEWIFFEMEV